MRAIELAAKVLHQEGLSLAHILELEEFDSALLLQQAVAVPPGVAQKTSGPVHRSELAHALELTQFVRLLGQVPSGAAYVREQFTNGRAVFLDHGAVRTVDFPNGTLLPAGIESVARILRPLGYAKTNTYNLKKLKMTGYSFTHHDFPADIAQWFVSELHPAQFSETFQEAVRRTLESTVDPIDGSAKEALDTLGERHEIEETSSLPLLRTLSKCFQRLHLAPRWSDYELLLKESAEMAWISTEGTTFNHATDRVEDLHATVSNERKQKRPMKETIEVSGSGRVQQTAHRAAQVRREFQSENGTVLHEVPGSFFEFISRATLPGSETLDLAFDASNAQGIFKMTDGTQL